VIDSDKSVRAKCSCLARPTLAKEKSPNARLESRREEIAALYFLLFHIHPYYREKYGYPLDDLPVARRVGESVLSLSPVPQMSERDAQDVVGAVEKMVGAYEH
jgi:dTDP-4-amino-4,6-dideoxygalactose transaminase